MFLSQHRDTQAILHFLNIYIYTHIYIYIYIHIYIYIYIYLLTIHEENTKENHNRIVSLYVIKTDVNLYLKKLIFSAKKT